VKAYRLQDLHLDKPNLIKADLEGSEVLMFQGARNFLSKIVPPCKILLEVHPMFYTKELSLENELRFLFNHNWKCKYMVSAAVLRPDKFKEAGLKVWKEFPSSGHSRAIYRNTGRKDWHDLVLDFACHVHRQEIPNKKVSPKIVRSILIEKNYDLEKNKKII